MCSIMRTEARVEEKVKTESCVAGLWGTAQHLRESEGSNSNGLAALSSKIVLMLYGCMHDKCAVMQGSGRGPGPEGI